MGGEGILSNIYDKGRGKVNQELSKNQRTADTSRRFLKGTILQDTAETFEGTTSTMSESEAIVQT